MTVESLASGLVGALVGSLITVAYLLWDRSQRLKAAGRAVLVEAARALVIVENMLSARAPDWPISRGTFDAVAPDIAALLTIDGLTTVARAHLMFEGAEAIRQASVARGSLLAGEIEKIASFKSHLEQAITLLGGQDEIRARAARLPGSSSQPSGVIRARCPT